MSIQKYQEARALIEATGDGDFEGPKPESLVAKAEAAIGLSFPPSYRHFLLEMGCGDIHGLEVFGLINDNFDTSTVPNGIWLTLNERREIGLHPAYVLIGEGGDGTFYAIDTGQVNDDFEAPVVRLSVAVDVAAAHFKEEMAVARRETETNRGLGLLPRVGGWGWEVGGGACALKD